MSRSRGTKFSWEVESIEVVKAFGQEKEEERLLKDVSEATVSAALKARSIKALLSPVVTITVAVALRLFCGEAPH